MPVPSNDKIIDMMFGSRGFKKRAESDLSDQHEYAQEWYGYWAGDRTFYESGIITTRKTMVVLNRIKPIIASLVGLSIQLRRKANYQARMLNQQAQVIYSEYLNGFSDYVRERSNADQIETKQNQDMFVCGYGAVDTALSYEAYGVTRDPNGDVIEENICPWDVWWDPMATAPNLLDATYVFRKKKFILEDAIKIFDATEDDFRNDLGNADSRYEFFPGGTVDRVAIEGSQRSNDRDLVDVYYLQWWEREEYWRVQNPLQQLAKLDPEQGQALLSVLESLQELHENQEKKKYYDDNFSFRPDAEFLVMDKKIYKNVKDIFMELEDGGVFEEFGIEPPVFDKGMRRCYYTAILTENRVFSAEKSLDQNGFTIKFKTADYDMRNRLWFGMVAQIKEPTLYSNKILTELLYIIASNSKGGVLYEENAVDDPSLLEKQWAQTDTAIMVKDGALSNNRIQPKASPQLPNGYDSLYPEFNMAIWDTAGLDKTFLGNSEGQGNETALLQRQRVKQVLGVLASYFDSIGLFDKEEAVLMLTYMRAMGESAPGRLFSFMDANGVKIVTQLSQDQFADEYDITISESADTGTQKEELALFLNNLAGTFLQAGKNIYPVTLKYMQPLGLKQEDIQQIIQTIQPQPDPQQQQLTQMAQQLHIENAKAEVANKVADAHYKQAGVVERQAKTGLIQQDAQQKHVETIQMLRTPPNHVNMTV